MQLPSFPNKDILKIHYGKNSAAEQFNLQQKLRKFAHVVTNGQKAKEQFDKKSRPQSFNIGDKVLKANDFDTTKTPKLLISAKLERPG